MTFKEFINREKREVHWCLPPYKRSILKVLIAIGIIVACLFLFGCQSTDWIPATKTELNDTRMELGLDKISKPNPYSEMIDWGIGLGIASLTGGMGVGEFVRRKFVQQKKITKKVATMEPEEANQYLVKKS